MPIRELLGTVEINNINPFVIFLLNPITKLLSLADKNTLKYFYLSKF